MKILAFLLALLIPVMSFAEIPGYYPALLVVNEIDIENDLVFFEDSLGNLWAVEDADDWVVGDLCSAIFWDCNTSDIYDDEIIDLRYEGAITWTTI